MRHKIIKIFLILLATLCFTLLPVTPTFAQCSDDVCTKNTYPDSVKAACGCKGSNKNQTEISTVVGNIIRTIIGILGIVAVVIIVIGGINYMTSAGDPSKVKKAKDTILYAIIGLVVCALAFGITQFAIDTINNSTNSNSSTNPANGGSNNNNNNNNNNNQDPNITIIDQAGH